MAITRYIGARYVPVFADPAEWTSTKQYEPLTIVLYQGNSFTSKQFVPVGIDINNTDYWAETGNYNAQVERLQDNIDALNAKFRFNNIAFEVSPSSTETHDEVYTPAFSVNAIPMLYWKINITNSDLNITVTESNSGFNVSAVNSSTTDTITFTFSYFAIGVE